MKKLKIKKKILKLKKKIKKYSYYYFNKNKNLIKNEKYDLLCNKLKNLGKIFPKYKKLTKFEKKINYILNNRFKKEKHIIPMLSIKSIYTFKNLNKYIKKINKKFNINKYCCELKIDGIAISLIYKKNKLYKSITRGNGKYGENVINNIKYIKSIPKKIKNNKKKIEIRGELFIKKKHFKQINKKKIFSNCRNLVSGTIKLKNKNIIKKRKLSFLPYDIIINNNRKKINNHFNIFKKIKNLGFKINKNIKICNNFKEIKSFYKNIEKKRKNLNFDIDGIVIKINNRKIQNIINNNNNYIKWAIALKFPSKKKKSKIKNIKFKIGKSGIILPIIIIKPIYIGGVKIKKINLYNLNYYKKLNININDSILIERKGDVIPKINKIITKNLNNNKNINIKNCPSCNKKINWNLNIPKCININCEKKLIKNIVNFISKNGFNIIGLGIKTIKQLVKYKIINSIIDIFKIKTKNLKKLPNFKYKKSNKIILSIKNSIKKIKLSNLIYSLSIPNIGLNTSIYINKKIKKLKNFIKIKKFEKKINKINKIKINSINNYLNNKNNYNNIKILKSIIFKYKKI